MHAWPLKDSWIRKERKIELHQLRDIMHKFITVSEVKAFFVHELYREEIQPAPEWLFLHERADTATKPVVSSIWCSQGSNKAIQLVCWSP